MRYKKSLIRTTLHRAYRLSSSWELVVRECDYLKGMFFKLGYPDRLVDAWSTELIASVNSEFGIPRRARGPDCLNEMQMARGPPKKGMQTLWPLRSAGVCLINAGGHEIIQEL